MECGCLAINIRNAIDLVKQKKGWRQGLEFSQLPTASVNMEISMIENTQEFQSVITCPECGFAKQETMPTNSCQFFYTCTNCHVRLKPKRGDCCVFCSYG